MLEVLYGSLTSPWYSVEKRDFNSYGSRRGNDEVMARGTFANIRLVNKVREPECSSNVLLDSFWYIVHWKGCTKDCPHPLRRRTRCV